LPASKRDLPNLPKLVIRLVSRNAPLQYRDESSGRMSHPSPIVAASVTTATPAARHCA